MLRLMCVIVIGLVTLPAVCEPASKYQVATIMEVKTHQAAAGAESDVVSYDVSVRVGDTVYLVLYTPPLGMSTIKYAGGRQLLVLVEEATITYNDILGNSQKVPIIGQKPAGDGKQSK
jgi:hypothetical protein